MDWMTLWYGVSMLNMKSFPGKEEILGSRFQVHLRLSHVDRRAYGGSTLMVPFTIGKGLMEEERGKAMVKVTEQVRYGFMQVWALDGVT